MKKIVYYDPATGAFDNAMTLDDGETPPGQAGLSWLEVPADANVKDHYVDPAGPTWTPRSAIALTYTPADKTAAADGVDEVVITGIPADTYVVAYLPDGKVAETVNDGQIEVSCTVAGTGQLNFYSNTHLRLTGEEVYFT